MRIVVIAPSRYAIREPHAGGLEAAVWNRVRTLRRRGHDVVLVAPRGSDLLDRTPPELQLPELAWGDERATDTTYPTGHLERALDALDGAMRFLSLHRDSIDLIENHSLHGVPLAWAPRLGIPMLTTLHTPPLPDMVEAARAARDAHGSSGGYMAVSEHTASAWRAEGIDARVLPNAIDTRRWSLGPGGDDLVWFGRIVPEKGPHVAIEAARLLDRRVVVAGRIGDADYFAEAIEPHLGPRVEHLGPMRQRSLARLVGRSAAALVTPLWDEPFGLVLAEALATGTPVAAFDRGGVAEVLRGAPGARLAASADAAGLADAVRAVMDAAPAERRRIREHAIQRFSLDRQSEDLESIYRTVVANHALARFDASAGDGSPVLA